MWLKIRFKYHLQLIKEKRWGGGQLWEGDYEKAWQTRVRFSSCRFKSVPSLLIRFSCDLVILLFLAQKGKSPYKWELSLPMDDAELFVCQMFLKIIFMPKRNILGWCTLVSYSHILRWHILVFYSFIR